MSRTLLSQQSKFRPLIKSFFFSAWLPITVLMLSIIRFGVDGWLETDHLLSRLKHLVQLFLLTWPCGLPLTIALQKTYRRRKGTAYVMGAILIPISAIFVTAGGLLGPIGIVGYAIVASLPAWLILSIICIIDQYRRQKMEPSDF